MSGTSLDGVDGVLVDFEETPRLISHAHIDFPATLRDELLNLCTPSSNELHRAAIAGQTLSHLYAQVVHELLSGTDYPVSAIGCHGQTIRHYPSDGYTIQLFNPALLAELTGLTVIADFRSRDIAAGGQGAPLVPAFHNAVFRHPLRHRVVVNIGGIANLTDIPPTGEICGFDCGPGNILLDGWINKCLGKPYDDNGNWAKLGKVQPELLAKFLDEPYFDIKPPKSTGRELFNMGWLIARIGEAFSPTDVQATLVELTACGVAYAIKRHCGEVEEVYVCGGGAYNNAIMERLTSLLGEIQLLTTDKLGIPAEHVEAFAFAWLASQTLDGRPGNLPTVTGANGARILGAIYPA